MVPSVTGMSGMGGGISTLEASDGPGNPLQVPSGLWIGTGGWRMKSPIFEEGENGVGVGVANGLGVASGPKAESPRVQLAKGIASEAIIRNNENSFLLVFFLSPSISLTRSFQLDTKTRFYTS